MGNTRCKKLWCFGPEGIGTNCLVNQTQSVNYLNETRDKIESAFDWVTREGVLAEETMRGIRFNLVDAAFHSDNVHRGEGQILPAARRCYYASQISAQPRFLEPIYQVDISVPNYYTNEIYKIFSQKKGIINSEEYVSGTPLVIMKGHLPVSQSFGFNSQLRAVTSGQAFPQCNFDHWEIIKDDPLEENSRAYEIMMDIRKRKGLKLEMIKYSNFVDKLN